MTTARTVYKSLQKGVNEHDGPGALTRETSELAIDGDSSSPAELKIDEATNRYTLGIKVGYIPGTFREKRLSEFICKVRDDCTSTSTPSSSEFQGTVPYTVDDTVSGVSGSDPDTRVGSVTTTRPWSQGTTVRTISWALVRQPRGERSLKAP